MFRICVIGCGNMARSGHGPAFAKYKRDYAIMAGIPARQIGRRDPETGEYPWEADK